MVHDQIETVTATIVNQLPDLYLAELIMVADYIDGLRGAREFLRRG